MDAPVRVLVRDDQALIRTGFTTIIDARPDLEVVGACAVISASGRYELVVDAEHACGPEAERVVGA